MSMHKAPLDKRKELGHVGRFNLGRYRAQHPRPPKPKPVPLLGDQDDAGLLGALAASLFPDCVKRTTEKIARLVSRYLEGRRKKA